MVDYCILLALNSLFIIGVYLLLQPEGLLSSLGIWMDRVLSAKIHPDKEKEIIAKGLWARSEPYGELKQRGLKMLKDRHPYAYFPIWKPIKGCVTCMSSLWGTLFFTYTHLVLDFEITWNLLYILPVYLLSLAGLNRILSVKADL